MTIWIDAHLSPAIARWISETFSLSAHALKDLGLRDAHDHEIFSKAKSANVVFITKDDNFLHLLETHGSPPKVIWLTCGNTSNAMLKEIFTLHLEKALQLLRDGNNLVEISQI